ncbi:recombinase family protein [Natronococcus jeotgali]|uniref:Uncharacterized protein n=1 Tax=Natronococcus jeotgali DSM 18795 TaxID=1227498 RepID=L9X0S0_9EURY|nr:hypothetical protein [Natronococcus jeotgali]ELY54198.1 hypothetical protein C492_16513 [Natronococcus jeotgali DSM 18795]
MIGNSEGVVYVQKSPPLESDDVLALGYVRLSQESDHSITVQKRDSREYCADRDLELLGILNEETGTSGFNETCEKYDEL